MGFSERRARSLELDSAVHVVVQVAVTASVQDAYVIAKRSLAEEAGIGARRIIAARRVYNPNISLLPSIFSWPLNMQCQRHRQLTTGIYPFSLSLSSAKQGVSRRWLMGLR